MPVKNEFSDRLKELVRLSGIKQQSIADTAGYDLSYVSKWMSGKMLPSEKTIGRTVRAISELIYNSHAGDQSWLVERYGRPFEEVDSRLIERELLSAYSISKESSISRSSYFVSMQSKEFYNSIYDLINGSDEIVLVVDLFAMDRESRQALIGLEEGFYKQLQIDPNKKVDLITRIDDSKNICYDAISLIHLMTVFSNYGFSVSNSDFASGKIIAVTPFQIISGFMIEETGRVFSIAKADAIGSGVELRNELLRVTQNAGQFFLKKRIDSFVNDKDYFKSMLSTNIKWIQGHTTELIISDELHEKLLKSIENVSIDEAQRIHSLSKNIIEQDSTSVLIYESALSDLIATGEIDFYNNKMILSPEEIDEYILFLMDVVRTCNVSLISAPLFAEFTHTFSPCLYISDTICYMRIEASYGRENIYEIIDRSARKLFDQLYSEIRINRTDVLVTEKSVILKRLENYKAMARV